MINSLVDAIAEMREGEAIQITRKMIEGGEDPMNIVQSGTEAMKIVGQRFEDGQYFLPHLIMAGDLLKRISEQVKPLIQGEIAKRTLGRVLMGTVKGDVHDIGKDIVTFLLEVNGFEVKDMGVDVPADRFVKEIEDFQPSVVGMSGLLTVANESMKKTIAAIAEAGLRDQVKIMIGGAQASQKVAEYTGADAYGKSAFEGVDLARKWTGVR